jgi:thymidylate kinase
MRSVALIGPDGAGKSTIAHEVVRVLGARARYVYMGVNVESSLQMLPTTRLAFALLRGRGRAAHPAAGPMTAQGTSSRRGGRVLREAYALVRSVAWLAEEWYRAFVANRYIRQGHIVVFDRHFLYDHYATQAFGGAGQPLATRLHGLLLRRFYPRPDFVVCLDAPAELLHERKREQSVRWLEAVRREYLSLGRVAPDFAVVDSTAPVATVVVNVIALIRARSS